MLQKPTIQEMRVWKKKIHMKNEFIKSLGGLKLDMCSTFSNMNDQLVIVKHDLKVSMDNLNLSKVKFYQKWNTPSGPTTRIWKIWGGRGGHREF